MAWGSKDKGSASSAAPTTKGSGRGSGMLSYIGSEVRIAGNISGNGDIHLDGTIEGDVSCKMLILGQNGSVKGNIIADKATLGGQVDGTVTAAALTVEAAARISGDLIYDNVSIENGAQVDGRMTRRTGGDQSGLKLVSTAGE